MRKRRGGEGGFTFEEEVVDEDEDDKRDKERVGQAIEDEDVENDIDEETVDEDLTDVNDAEEYLDLVQLTADHNLDSSPHASLDSR